MIVKKLSVEIYVEVIHCHYISDKFIQRYVNRMLKNLVNKMISKKDTFAE